MFDLADKRLVWIPVKWPGVKGEGDELAENVTFEIDCQVEIVSKERLDEIFGSPAKGTETALSELEKFKALVHDWRKVKAGGKSAPMTDENILAMLAVPMFPTGFEQSYINAWTGQLEAREKNFEGSSKDGQATAASGSEPSPAPAK